MSMFYRHNRGGKRLQRKPKSENNSGVRLAALLLCLSMLMGFLPALASAADDGEKLSSIVTFESISLHYAGAGGQPKAAAIQDGALIERDKQLALRYTYTITEGQCSQIVAGTNYYLEVSPHLSLPDLSGGSELTVETDDGPVPFGKIYSDGSRAWVTFDAKSDGSDTVLSDYGELNNAFFYLNCNRAGSVPSGESPIEGSSNLYAMKFENNKQITFGYAENEPVTARAQINKDGKLQDKTITWTINYTPWQNPAANDSVTLDTPFELRDTIDTSLHSYVDGSVTIDGSSIPSYTSRDNIPTGAGTYVLVETPENGSNTVLTFGGTKFNAGEATQGNPATPLTIAYQTSINDDLLLPGGTGGKKVTNAADLFAGESGVFNSLNITSSSTVPIPQPTWVTKEGHTTRDPGNGSTTDWTVTFQPNGFTFTEDNGLTLHDQLPEGSEPVRGSLKVNGTQTSVTVGANNSFTVSPIVPDGNAAVKITYQTHVPEDMYDSGTSLGSNIAWFTFQYGGQEYTTPEAKKDIGSGDGSGTPARPRW